MSASPQPPDRITDQEIASALHALNLMNSQVKNGHIDHEYTLNQIKRLQHLLERFKMQQETRRAGSRFEALYNVSLALGTSLDLQTVLSQVMDAVVQLTGAERGFVMLRDDDGDLKIKVARNYDQRTVTTDQFNYSRSIAAYVMERGEAVLTTNALEDPRFSGHASVITQALRSIMVAPLRARGVVIGIAYVENRVITGLFKADDLATLEMLAAQASVTIDNAMLFSATDEALAHRADELSQLRGIDLKLSEKLELDATIAYTLEAACNLTKASEGYLGMVHVDSSHIIANHHYLENGLRNSKRVYLDDLYPHVREVVETGKAMVFDAGQYGLQTVLALPIIRNRVVVGVLTLKREDGSTFTMDQREIVERVVSRAAIAIENARLYAAVQQADKAKSEFVGIVAHDLKSPMTSILGYADLTLMHKENLTERQVTYLGRIHDTVRRMEILVSDLSDISRIESGQFYMEETPVTVGGIIETAIETIMPQLQARKHHLKQDIEPNLPDLKADFYRLLQVLTNLLSNACKYTPDGGTITLRVKREAERVRFEVDDTGIGLSKKSLQMLGTKFWRAEDEYTRNQPGTGLGFAITTALVKQMGSPMDVTSELGRGSQFAFSVVALPVTTPQE